MRRATELGTSHPRTSQVANVRAQWQGHAEKPRGPDPCPGELELGVVQPQGWGQPAGKAECRGREVAGPAHHSVHLSLHPERVGTPSRHQREKQGPRNLPLRLHTHPSSQNPTVHGAVALAKWAKGLEPPHPPPNEHTACQLPGDPSAPSCVTWNDLPLPEAPDTTPSSSQMPEDHRSRCRKTPETWRKP